MPSYRGFDIGPGRGGFEARVGRFRRDDSGAIVLLGLVAIMILMLLAWVLFDAGKMGRHKLTVQAAADTAAYSQSAVKARAMNNLVYANIAKRSVVGIHSQYMALWTAYRDWFAARTAACAAGDSYSCDIVANNTPIAEAEQEHDFKIFHDDLAKEYYLQDVVAIDNYQRYIHALAPWWGWSEAVLRASRNGATMAASYPAPRGKAHSAAVLGKITDRVVSQVGWTPTAPFTGHRDVLPVKVSSYEDMLEYGMGPDLSFNQYEYDANLAMHKHASDKAAKSTALLAAARPFFGDAVLDYTQSVFGDHGRPLRLFETRNRARWSTWTSNLVVAYRSREELFGEMRQKYDPVRGDYEHVNGDRYRIGGYWAMARSEITFHGRHRIPDLWHPQWTGRMRPVALPNEFQEAGLQMSSIYHDLLPYLALSGIATTGNADVVEDSFDDLVFMERASKALGQSTVEGIPK